MNRVNYHTLMASLPPAYGTDLKPANRNHFFFAEISLIVLDDDPTGTQTISDVPVLTSWQRDVIEAELNNQTPLFFVLTNSRSLTAENARMLALEIGSNIKAASEKTGRKVCVISRGDSTLRGHYPVEVDALGAGLGIPEAPHLLIPAFFQGGRYTIGDVHYVREGDELIPAGETPFAADSTFGYTSSDLKDYVEEKTGGSVSAGSVVSIGLDDIRNGGAERIKQVLKKLQQKQVCILNAASQSDLDVFASAFYTSGMAGNLLLRTAASVIPSLAGMAVNPPLEADHLNLEGRGGIVAVGSYVPKTTAQLIYLQKNMELEYLEINVASLLEEQAFYREIHVLAEKINKNLWSGRTIVLFTSRDLVRGNSPEESLAIVNRVSAGMTEVIKNVHVRPRFILAKGGITSSDILTRALDVKKARVLGQIIPGVPLWKLNECNRFPGIEYIPFPGNLGGEDALFNVLQKLNPKPEKSETAEDIDRL